MAFEHLDDPFIHFGAMVEQLIRQNQTLIGHIDRVVTAQSELGQDMRVRHRAVEKMLADLRQETNTRLADLRSEMHSRFDAVGSRFDESDARSDRLERAVKALQSDLLGLENGIINAQQSALQAHLRLGERRDEGSGE